MNIPVRYDIKKFLPKYERIRVLVDSDEDKYDTETFCPKLPNESANARDVRKVLYKKSFLNISNDLIGATKDAIFHEGIRLEFTGGESNPLYQWHNDVTLGHDNTNLINYCQDVVIEGLRAYGHVWTILDKPDYNANNFQDELQNGAPYICNVYPGDVINYEILDGQLLWFAYKCNYYPTWTNPLEKQPTFANTEQTRIWTRDKFIVIEVLNGKEKAKEFSHNFGFVPVIGQSFVESSDANSLLGLTPFFTTSNLIISANSLKSVADLEIYKHGTSVLMMNDSVVSSLNQETDDKGKTRPKMQDPEGYNIFMFSGEQKPEYLVKDLQAVDKANSQSLYYFNAAIQNERSLQSIQKKRDTVRESGETKQYDAEPARAALRTTSNKLELWCKKVLNMVAMMLDREKLTDSYVCEFPQRYILTKSVEEKFANIKSAIENQYPSITGRKEMFKSLTPDIAHDEELRAIIDKEIDAADIVVDPDEQVMKEVEKEMAAQNKEKETSTKSAE